MDVFGLKDQLQMIGHAEGISPAPDARQQKFIDDIRAYQTGQTGQPLPAGVATGGPAMAAPGMPSPAVQTVANAMPQPMIGQPPMQQQPMPMMGGFSGVQLPRFR